MKYAKEFGYTGQMLPILINYMVIHHTLPLRDNSINDQSYTYNILSHLSISGDWWYASLLTMAVTILLGEAITLLIKLYLQCAMFCPSLRLTATPSRMLHAQIPVLLQLHWILTNVGLFTVYFIFLQKYLYNEYSLIYVYLNVNQYESYIYTYIYLYVCLHPELWQSNHVLLHVFYYIITCNVLRILITCILTCIQRSLEQQMSSSVRVDRYGQPLG